MKKDFVFIVSYWDDEDGKDYTQENGAVFKNYKDAKDFLQERKHEEIKLFESIGYNVEIVQDDDTLFKLSCDDNHRIVEYWIEEWEVE